MTEHSELRRRLEEKDRALQSSEAGLKEFITRNPDGFLVVDRSGRIRFANPAAGALFSRSAFDLLDDHFDFPAITGETIELEIPAPHDRTRVVEVRVVESEWETDPAYLVSLHDITRRKELERRNEYLNRRLAERTAELEASNKEIETFSYSVTHDLRKPLTIINGYCQVLKDLFAEKLDEQCKYYLEEIYTGTLRMNQLIDALLRFSVVSRSEPRREPVNLSIMATTAALELKLAEPERAVTIKVADGVVVNGDPNLLRIVLDNLLGNAWKYTSREDKAIIEFGQTIVNGKPACFIRDNGIGFSMDDAGKVFTPFQRLLGTDDFKGHGIGLATVHRIVQRHGGTIWAEGETGKGATFYFMLG